MTKPPEHRVYLGVWGFEDDPAVVTRLMGIEPTTAWGKGDPWPNHSHLKHRHSLWSLESGLAPSESITAHFLDLLPALESRGEALLEVMKKFDAAIQVVAYWYCANPGFDLSADLVRRIAALGLSLDFDFYCLGDDVDESELVPKVE